MDAGLPESHVATGRVAVIEMSWSEAEAAYNRAMVLNPGDINALNAISMLMIVLGRYDEGLKYALMALERDPAGLAQCNHCLLPDGSMC